MNALDMVLAELKRRTLDDYAPDADTEVQLNYLRDRDHDVIVRETATRLQVLQSLFPDEPTVSPHRMLLAFLFTPPELLMGQMATEPTVDGLTALLADHFGGTAPNLRVIRISLASMTDELRGAIKPFESKLAVIDGSMAEQFLAELAREYDGPRLVVPR